MITFGCSIITPDIYERFASPGIERAREPDSVVLAHAAAGSVARSFNLLLDRAAKLDGLEALVLLHEDAELLDAAFASKLRAALADPQVAIVGSVGARGVNDIAWWDGELVSNSAAYHHPDAGGGELTFRGLAGSADDGAPGEVDTIYGVMMALSPWAVANLRFDESIGMLHGYDFDVCRQARTAGRKVITADLVTQIEIWVGAHMRAAEAWDDTTPPRDAPDQAWRERARRAEAGAAAARLLAASKLLQADASSQMYARELGFVQRTRSWRMTESLRRGNALVRAARRRLKGGPAS